MYIDRCMFNANLSHNQPPLFALVSDRAPVPYFLHAENGFFGGAKEPIIKARKGIVLWKKRTENNSSVVEPDNRPSRCRHRCAHLAGPSFDILPAFRTHSKVFRMFFDRGNEIF